MSGPTNDVAKSWRTVLEHVASRVVREHAVAIDRDGEFPQAAIDALSQSGLFGVLSAPEVGGLGLGLTEASAVVERLARECGSTAMIMCMHYCGATVLEAHASAAIRTAVATGELLSTLAFSEVGSRSHFWAPQSTAVSAGDDVILHGRKSWVTSARAAGAYVWSSCATDSADGVTLWLVPRGTHGLSIPAPFMGLGLRGNDSTPVTAEGARIPKTHRLGPEGGGLEIMMGPVLAVFQVMNASCSLGLMETGTQKTAAHVSSTQFGHVDLALRDLPTIRAYLSRMRIKTDMVRALLADTLDAIREHRDNEQLRVLEIKAAAGEAASEVLDLAMRVCGGAAFRQEVGLERYFRDSRAATVMAPTTDMLYDFIGKALTGMDPYA